VSSRAATGHADSRAARFCRCSVIWPDELESGAYPVESYDRETVYFVKNGRVSTINAVPLKSEGAVTAVIGMPAVSDQSLWTVVPEGIYFTPMEAPTSVQYFDFATKHVRRIFKFERNFAMACRFRQTAASCFIHRSTRKTATSCLLKIFASRTFDLSRRPKASASASTRRISTPANYAARA
jgi:hypothetical protein